jgi:hypothetical protein
MLGDSEAELGHVREIDVADVDATQDFALGVDDDEVQGGALLVLAYPIGKAVIEVLEVLVTAVTDPRGEEGPVGPLEPFQGARVLEAEKLQPRHGVHGSSQPECGTPLNRISMRWCDMG